MSEFIKYKKADLSNALKKLGEPTIRKDTKKVLLERLDKYLQLNPGQTAHVHQFLEETGSGLVEGEEVTIIEDEPAKVEEEEDSEDDGSEEDDSDDDEDDDEEEEEEEEIIEVVTTADDDESDKDYQAPPPLNLKELVLDPIIYHSENIIDKVHDVTDYFGFNLLETTERIRDHLSSSITLNYLEIALEFLIFIYNFTTVVPLNQNKLIHQFFHDNLPFISNSTYPTIEFSDLLFNYKSLSTLSIWFTSAIVLPNLISYFINFTSRIVEIEDDEYLFRIHTYDPFIFAISKILIYYFIGQSGLINFSKHEWFWSAIQNKILMQLGLYNTALASTLGSLPYVLGGVNVLIALYAQFEEY